MNSNMNISGSRKAYASTGIGTLGIGANIGSSPQTPKLKITPEEARENTAINLRQNINANIENTVARTMINIDARSRSGYDNALVMNLEWGRDYCTAFPVLLWKPKAILSEMAKGVHEVLEKKGFRICYEWEGINKVKMIVKW